MMHIYILHAEAGEERLNCRVKSFGHSRAALVKNNKNMYMVILCVRVIKTVCRVRPFEKVNLPSASFRAYLDAW